MLNEEKVRHMTKAAAYENGPEKKNIGISDYFRGDYLGLQLVKSGIAYTFAFVKESGYAIPLPTEDIITGKPVFTLYTPNNINKAPNMDKKLSFSCKIRTPAIIDTTVVKDVKIVYLEVEDVIF
mgnify:CR=1 FL=1